MRRPDAKHAVNSLGMTLLEVLLAIAVLGISATVLSQSFVNTLTALDLLNDNADLNAERRFVRQQISSIEDRSTVEQGGDITLPSGQKIRWSAEVNDGPLLDLFELQLNLEIEDTNEHSDTLSSETESLWIFQPSWSDAFDKGILKSDLKERIENDRMMKDFL
jgi:prepilin-type N-terminal cleavage/methylation domain-containing protein